MTTTPIPLTTRVYDYGLTTNIGQDVAPVISPGFLKLSTGDYLLLSTGDKLILSERVTGAITLHTRTHDYSLTTEV